MLQSLRSDQSKRRKHLKNLKKKPKRKKRRKRERSKKRKRKRKLKKKQRSQVRESKLLLLKKQHLQVLKRKRRKRRRRRLMLLSSLLFHDQLMKDLKTCLFILMISTVLDFWRQLILNLRQKSLRKRTEQLMYSQIFLLRSNSLGNHLMRKIIGVEDQLNSLKTFHFLLMKKLKISKILNVNLELYSLKIKWKRSLIKTQKN